MNDAKSILLLTRYGPNGPSSRVRHYQYVPALQAAGFRVISKPFFDEGYIDLLYEGQSRRRLFLRALARRLLLLPTLGQYDLIWVEKEALPWCPIAMERAYLRARRYLVDFDDQWNIRYSEHERFMVRNLLGQKLEQVASGATAVVAGNRWIAEWASGSGAQLVFQIPSVVAVERYSPSDWPEGPFTIGWIGTPITEKYLSIISGPLRHLQENHGAKVRIIGAHQSFSMEGLSIERVPWSEATEAAELAKCHVGVMPLPDEPWERGKCGYKLVQFMAAGRPVVASPVGANSDIIIHGKTGYLAAELDQWLSYLQQLATKPELRQELGSAARARVAANFSTNVTTPQLISVFEQVIGARALATRSGL